jgi:polyisoprenoid-binding protein YceI
MWKALAAAALAGAVLLTPRSPAESDRRPPPKALEIDPVHSSAVFRVIHLEAAAFWGRFNDISGQLAIDAKDLEHSSIAVTIRTDSVDTGNDDRDKHLRSQDFFAATEFPEATFASTKIEAAGADRYRVTGDLELRGTKKSITFEAVHTGTAEVSKRFGKRSGYEATFEIDRTDFGISYGAADGALGKLVRLIIAVEVAHQE